MQLISVVTPCFNEEDNVYELVQRIKQVFSELPQFRYEHIFIDNASTDATVEKVKAIIAHDSNIKLIVNARNFGHIRSPVYGVLQSNGDAVIIMASDLQDPPELITDFLRKWEEGYKVVAGVKPQSKETMAMFLIRRLYYRLVTKIADVKLIPNFTGFGLYDRSIVELIRKLNDPYPYFRGLVSEFGVEVAKVEYLQPKRVRGITKNNFYTLYDMAMLGIVSHSKLPIRIATICGFIMSLVSMVLSIMFLIFKLIAWEKFGIGMAPVLIGLFFFGSVQLFFIGILGEYVLSIHTKVQGRPLVVEKERLNL